MSDTPFVSIIIPMYNTERYVKICIQSILAQTLQDFEIIIIDDCSTDNSYKLCQELYGNNEKIRLFHQEKNQGQGPARNVGIEQARGEYIWFIDSDDAIVPNSVEKLYKTAKIQPDIDAIHIKGHYATAQDDEKPLDLRRITINWEGNPNVGFLTEDIPRRLAENWATNKIPGMTVQTVWNRKFIIENKMNFINTFFFGEDQVYTLFGLCLSKKIFFLKEAFYIYRRREGSSSTKTDVAIGIKSMHIIANELQTFFDKIPQLDKHKTLKDQCINQACDPLLRDHARPLYDGVHIPLELDKAVYETMLPIFGENTTLVKYLFHGFNNMWRQANVLGYQNYLLRQKDDLLKQQNKLIEQMNKLLEQQNRQLQQLKNM